MSAAPLPPPDLRFMGESDEIFLPVCDHLANNVLRSMTGKRFDVLDVGCGYGRLAYGLRRAGFEGRYRGFDILRTQISWLKEHFATPEDAERYDFSFFNVHNARYNPAGMPFDTLTLPYAPGSVDCLTAFSVFTHMYDDDIAQYLRRLAPLLRDGGLVIATFFSVPDAFTLAGQSPSMRYRLSEQISPHAFIHDPAQPLHVIAYREAFLRAMIEAEGLEVVSHQPGTWLDDAYAGEFQDWFVLRKRSAAVARAAPVAAACNICGGTEFGPGPSGRMASTGLAPHCRRCDALERQRIGRRLFQALPIGALDWRRCLQFSPDQASEPRWFRSHELSIYSGAGSLDVQAIDRADASYDFVTLSHVLECIPRDLGAFDELIRVLSPNGVLHLGLAGALSREKSIDQATPMDPYGTLHLYGRDVYQRFGCAQKRLGMLIVEGEDPVTGVRDVIHLFTRHAPDVRRLRAWMADWDPSITIIEEVPALSGGAPDLGAPGARATQRLFQALPLGMLAWRRAALAADVGGINPAWFDGACVAWPCSGAGDTLDFVALTDAPDPAVADAAARLARRGVLYVLDAADAATPHTLENGLVRLRAVLPGWTIFAVESPDADGAARAAWLGFRSARDAAAWARQLRDWCGGLRLLPADAADGAPAGAGLPRLRAELARWEAEGLDCPLWWRDDDLIGDGPALRRLAAMSARFGVPALMAVIPAQADSDLADCTAEMPTLSFCQHGWNHVSHEGEGRPKSEFGAARPPAEAERDIARGAAWMRAAFGARFLPVFVPPWNSITPALAARLPALGLHGLSQYVGMAPLRAPGLVRVDTHADIVDWGVKGGVRDPDELVERVVAMLQLRMEGNLYEPIGILSHHRAMGEGTWAFLEQLFEVLEEYACVRWLDAPKLFSARRLTPMQCAA